MYSAMHVIIFLVCIVSVLAENDVLMYVTGEVSRGNYSYYSLTYEGCVTLQLYSLSGDADLYVSQLTSTPTFEPDTYCLHSATCGLDVVHIPGSFRRPVAVGVYGHPSHETSTYLLEALFQHEDATAATIYFYDDIPNEGESEKSWSNTFRDIPHEKSDHPKEEDESFVIALIWSFIDILLEVLFL